MSAEKNSVDSVAATKNTALTASLTNELCYFLERLVLLHGNLVSLLLEEYAHMVALNIKGLAEAAHSKEIILGEIFQNEELRIRAVEHLSAELSLDSSQATLLSIAKLLPVSEAEKLKNSRTTLNLLVDEAKKLNAKNMVFAESSLNRIDSMKKNVLGMNNNAPSENYSNAGIRESASEQGGRLLSTEA